MGLDWAEVSRGVSYSRFAPRGGLAWGISWSPPYPFPTWSPKLLGEWPYRHGLFMGNGDDVKDYSCLHWALPDALQSPVVTARKHPGSIPRFQISLAFLVAQCSFGRQHWAA